MSEPNPLAGLTAEQADQAIERLQAKIDARENDLKAVKAQLKAMKAARKDLADPAPADAQNNGAVAQAQPAELTVEGGKIG